MRTAEIFLTGKPSSKMIVIDCWHGAVVTVIFASKKLPLNRMSNPFGLTVPFTNLIEIIDLVLPASTDFSSGDLELRRSIELIIGTLAS